MADKYDVLKDSAASTDLVPYLRAIGRRLRLRDGLELAAATLWLPLAIACAGLVAARLLPLAGYRAWVWAALVAWALAMPGYALFRRQGISQVARRADRELGLRERLSTALELARSPAGFDPDLAARQQADALAAARRVQPAADLPVRWPRRPLALAGAALAAALALTLVPNPMDAVLRQRAEVARVAVEEAARLERAADTVEKSTALDPAQKDELLKQLREMAARLRANPGDRDKALTDLAEFQAELRRKLDPQAPARMSSLDSLAAQLAQLAGEKDQSPSLEQAAQLLDQLAAESGQQTPAQREQAARALEQAASRLGDADAGLAQALGDAAAAVRRGDAAGARSAAARANAALAQARKDLAAQEALARALSEAQASGQRMAQAGQAGKGASRQANANGGQGSQGAGQPGTGAGQGGQPGSGGGTQANQLPPANRSGVARDPTKPNKGYGVDATVYAPGAPATASSEGKPDFIPGQQNAGGETQTRESKSPLPGAANPAVVPYQQVFSAYAAQANEAMAREYVPLNLRDYVQAYFTQLEP